MYCKSCGESLKAGVKFCGKCGAVVDATASEGIRCPKCGAVNRPGAKFCRQDGTSLVDAPATSQEPRAVAPVVERVASPAAPIVRPVRTEPPPAEPAPRLQPVQAEAAKASSGGGTSRPWLALGALAVLAAIGGGYWFYKSRGASSPVTETSQAPMAQTPGTDAAPEPEGDVVEVPPPVAKSGTPPPAQSQVGDAPQVSVGDRWVTEVVDHQDPKLNYRAERTVTEVGNDRIVTSVRTVGKDYVRSVEYSGQWALIATHLPSGATTTYSPALPYLSFPLQPGKSWQARVVEIDAEGKQRVHDVKAKMESWETVQVPAGTFNALKVVLTDDISKDGVVVQQGQDVSWYAPVARRTVKTEESSFDPASGERRRRTISLVEYALQAPGAALAEAGGDSRIPPAEVISAGGCPFEGCQLGEWTAREPAVLYDRPNGVQTETVRAGDRVVAIEAQVRAQPLRAVVTKAYETDEQQGIHVGDVVYALYPLGEGAVAVWHGDRVKEGSLELGLLFEDEKESMELHYVWWVHVKLPDGRMGWIKDPRGFDGMDALG